MIATITLNHNEVKKALETFVRTTYSTTVPLDDVVLDVTTILADNAVYDVSYSATLTFSMENVPPVNQGPVFR